MDSATLVGLSDETYELIEMLGEGGFGAVYLARKNPLKKLVALKLLEHRVSAVAERRLWDEAMLLASLHHPGIVAAEDLVQLEGRLGLVTEYVEGEDLSVCLDDGMPASVVVEVIAAVAWALHVASQKGVIHRDVKPQNIRIGRHGNVKLLDFGIAFVEGAERASDPTQTMIGTPRYMAPERFQFEFSPASDVFSLGCILWLGLEGTHFYGEQKTPDQILPFTRSDDRWNVLLNAAFRERLPASLEDLLRSMLARKSQSRPSAAEVARCCEASLERWPRRKRLSEWCRERWPDGVTIANIPSDKTPSSLARRAVSDPEDEATEIADATQILSATPLPAESAPPPPLPEPTRDFTAQPLFPFPPPRPEPMLERWAPLAALSIAPLLAVGLLITGGLIAAIVIGLSEPVSVRGAGPQLSLPPPATLEGERQSEETRSSAIETPSAPPKASKNSSLADPAAIRDMIGERVAALTPTLDSCYEQRQQEHEPGKGRWLLTFSVLPSGETGDVAMKARDVADGGIERCVIERVKASWHFGPIAKTQPVSRTLRFPP